MKRTPRVGAFVLETLTTGMYTNPLDSLREFVQNSSDAIREAESEGLLKDGAGRIEIWADPKRRSIRIRDNGIGIGPEEAYSRLTDVGLSRKRVESDIGFRGIGRLAGIAYCESLYFRTSTHDSRRAVTVFLDCKGLRKAILPGKQEVGELADVLRDFSAEETGNCRADEHFFEVELENLAVSADAFLDVEKLQAYLSQVVPVIFDAQRFFFSKKITEWARKHDLCLPTATVVIKAPVEMQVFKPYKPHYRTLDDKYSIEVQDICFYPEDASPASPYWLWYAKTPLLGIFNDPRVAGLRFRRLNMAIGGPERVAEIFAEIAQSYGRLNSWYIGEIHVQDPGVVPNARRDGFEDNAKWMEIKDDLKQFFRARVKDAQDLSKARNRPTVKAARSAEEILNSVTARLDSGLVSSDERASLLEKVVREKAAISQAAETRLKPEESELLRTLESRLAGVEESLKNENHFALKKLRTHLDRKQRKLLREVLEVLRNTLDEKHFVLARDAILAKYQIQED